MVETTHLEMFENTHLEMVENDPPDVRKKRPVVFIKVTRRF